MMQRSKWAMRKSDGSNATAPNEDFEPYLL